MPSNGALQSCNNEKTKKKGRIIYVFGEEPVCTPKKKAGLKTMTFLPIYRLTHTINHVNTFAYGIQENVTVKYNTLSVRPKSRTNKQKFAV